ncbi:uncharacterized protein LOC115732293 [Rhodamnia argentea]|uniref:Uncharacterized protein LOC115732293 n=1 Tax=Rhodamnia argentea TaxID=178133 RepID=A0A8B8N8N0_9MYRT|nr:uncharacterized protein LOC115732293 [Rhodamnia argentea]
MSFDHSYRATSLPTQAPPLAERITDDPVTIKTAQSTVTLAYQANIAGYWHNVTIIWCKNLMNHSLSITVDSLEGDFHYTCKIDLKPWHFWSKKGYKSFEVESNRVDVYWDLRSAKFSGSPEPCTDYYVALVSDEEVVLLLGDYKKKAYKRTKSRPALVDAVLFYKKENVFGKKTFATRARFDERTKEHEITVESTTFGHREPEMWINIDGALVIHVRNLDWKFRGNQNILVNKQPVQVFWDVHDWMFKSPGTGHGLFIFKPGLVEAESDKDGSSRGANSDSSTASRYYSARTGSTAPDFCLFLYAWKVE